MKQWIAVTSLVVGMLAAPVAQAGPYQDRTVANGASQGQVAEGVILGAVLGTLAGAIIASQSEPVYVVGHRKHRYDRDDRIRYERGERARYHSHDRRHEHRF